MNSLTIHILQKYKANFAWFSLLFVTLTSHRTPDGWTEPLRGRGTWAQGTYFGSDGFAGKLPALTGTFPAYA